MSERDQDEASSVHTSAIVDPNATIGEDVRIGAGASVGRGCVVGSGAVIAEHVVLAPGVVVGQGSSLGPGAYVRSGVTLGVGVTVGPNATFVGQDFTDATTEPVSVEDGASIGANASVIGAVAIGRRSVVGAGAVVTHDVPPFAIVVGSPARIVGYESSTNLRVSRRLRASALRDDEFPLQIGNARASRMPRVIDLRGSLTFGEVSAHLPFEPLRYFLISDVPSSEVRGEHAHRTLHQLLICVKGEVAVAIDDGSERGELVLDRPDVALHLPPMVWGRQYRYSQDAVLLVLASDVYDDADYIRAYDEFLRLHADA